ncbi:MAG TPA: hypothetical protein VHE12_13020 [bacterium]|nr:hypothetical protein [bacterium]
MERSAPPSFFATYALAGRQALKVWPLFLVEFLFMVLKYGAFLLSLAVLFGPFLARNMGRLLEGLKDPKGYDWSEVVGDWLGMVSDVSWWVILGVVVLLATTWWCLLAALEDGGIYGTFWDLAREGNLFSFGRFLERAFQLLLPMIWLQIYLGLFVLLALAFWVVLGLLAAGFLGLLGFPFGLGLALGVLLGALFLLFWVLFGIGFGAFSYLAKAYVALGVGAGDSIRRAYAKFKADSWRVGLGMTVALVLYIAVTTAIRTFFVFLGMIPLLGILFKMVDMLIALVLALLVLVLFPGLSVTYLQDEAEA